MTYLCQCLMIAFVESTRVPSRSNRRPSKVCTSLVSEAIADAMLREIVAATATGQMPRSVTYIV